MSLLNRLRNASAHEIPYLLSPKYLDSSSFPQLCSIFEWLSHNQRHHQSVKDWNHLCNYLSHRIRLAAGEGETKSLTLRPSTNSQRFHLAHNQIPQPHAVVSLLTSLSKCTDKSISYELASLLFSCLPPNAPLTGPQLLEMAKSLEANKHFSGTPVQVLLYHSDRIGADLSLLDASRLFTVLSSHNIFSKSLFGNIKNRILSSTGAIENEELIMLAEGLSLTKASNETKELWLAIGDEAAYRVSDLSVSELAKFARYIAEAQVVHQRFFDVLGHHIAYEVFDEATERAKALEGRPAFMPREQFEQQSPWSKKQQIFGKKKVIQSHPLLPLEPSAEPKPSRKSALRVITTTNVDTLPTPQVPLLSTRASIINEKKRLKKVTGQDVKDILLAFDIVKYYPNTAIVALTRALVKNFESYSQKWKGSDIVRIFACLCQSGVDIPKQAKLVELITRRIAELGGTKHLTSNEIGRLCVSLTQQSRGVYVNLLNQPLKYHSKEHNGRKKKKLWISLQQSNEQGSVTSVSIGKMWTMKYNLLPSTLLAAMMHGSPAIEMFKGIERMEKHSYYHPISGVALECNPELGKEERFTEERTEHLTKLLSQVPYRKLMDTTLEVCVQKIFGAVRRSSPVPDENYLPALVSTKFLPNFSWAEETPDQFFLPTSSLLPIGEDSVRITGGEEVKLPPLLLLDGSLNPLEDDSSFPLSNVKKENTPLYSYSVPRSNSDTTSEKDSNLLLSSDTRMLRRSSAKALCNSMYITMLSYAYLFNPIQWIKSIDGDTLYPLPKGMVTNGNFLFESYKIPTLLQSTNIESCSVADSLRTISLKSLSHLYDVFYMLDNALPWMENPNTLSKIARRRHLETSESNGTNRSLATQLPSVKFKNKHQLELKLEETERLLFHGGNEAAFNDITGQDVNSEFTTGGIIKMGGRRSRDIFEHPPCSSKMHSSVLQTLHNISGNLEYWLSGENLELENQILSTQLNNQLVRSLSRKQRRKLKKKKKSRYLINNIPSRYLTPNEAYNSKMIALTKMAFHKSIVQSPVIASKIAIKLAFNSSATQSSHFNYNQTLTRETAEDHVNHVEKAIQWAFIRILTSILESHQVQLNSSKFKRIAKQCAAEYGLDEETKYAAVPPFLLRKTLEMCREGMEIERNKRMIEELEPRGRIYDAKVMNKFSFLSSKYSRQSGSLMYGIKKDDASIVNLLHDIEREKDIENMIRTIEKDYMGLFSTFFGKAESSEDEDSSSQSDNDGEDSDSFDENDKMSSEFQKAEELKNENAVILSEIQAGPFWIDCVVMRASVKNKWLERDNQTPAIEPWRKGRKESFEGRRRESYYRRQNEDIIRTELEKDY